MAYQIVDSSKERMEKALGHLSEELATIRTGAANPTMLNSIEVDYYGSPTPVNQIASISVVEGKQLVIKPYDPTSLKEIEKAINKSDLGLPPQNDGTVIRLNVPQLTGDVRKDMVKKVSKMGEEAKVQMRNIRRDANTDIKKDKELTEDMQKDAQDEIQKLTDSYTKKIDELCKKKSDEVQKV